MRACVLSCYAFLAHSKATHHQVKRDSESLYDNIYSAIAEFSSNPEEEDLPPQKRSSNFGQGSNQLPRGGKQRRTPRSFLDRLLATFQKPGPPPSAQRRRNRKTLHGPLMGGHLKPRQIPPMRAVFRPSPRMGLGEEAGIQTTRLSPPLSQSIKNPRNPFLRPNTPPSQSSALSQNLDLITTIRPVLNAATTKPFLPMTFLQNEVSYDPITTYHPSPAILPTTPSPSASQEPFLPFLSTFQAKPAVVASSASSSSSSASDLFATLPPLPSNAIIYRPDDETPRNKGSFQKAAEPFQLELGHFAKDGPESSSHSATRFKKFEPHQSPREKKAPSKSKDILTQTIIVRPHFNSVIVHPPKLQSVTESNSRPHSFPTFEGEFSGGNSVVPPPLPPPSLKNPPFKHSLSSFKMTEDDFEVFDSMQNPFSRPESSPQHLSFSSLFQESSPVLSSHRPQFISHSGRQATRQVVVDGFPNGLPQGTPKGVAIALASAQNLAPGEMPPIPGEAGVDYPVLTEVPETGFDCNAQTFPGIYADTGADCQVFYMCQPNGNFNAFLCPNGTVFNQQYFICDWWYNFDCGDAESFYGLNEFIYQDQPAGKKCDSLFCSED
eukprot:TCALIF_03842-PA protein Name:"Protein of unknown function" AED:0.06 eAED:0.06 QI:0/0.5/0.4/0.8/0.75/0.8/5/487/606